MEHCRTFQKGLLSRNNQLQLSTNRIRNYFSQKADALARNFTTRRRNDRNYVQQPEINVMISNFLYQRVILTLLILVQVTGAPAAN